MRGKKLKITIICIILVMVICVGLLLMLSALKNKNKAMPSDTYGQPLKSTDDSCWKQATSGQIFLEKGHIQMDMDASTGHFCIKDTKNNVTYDSAVLKDLNGAKIERTAQSQSELIAYYYDENRQKK